MTPDWRPCGRGVCAAEDGHEGTCDEASGWDYDWRAEYAATVVARIVGQIKRRDRAPLLWTGDQA